MWIGGNCDKIISSGKRGKNCDKKIESYFNIYYKLMFAESLALFLTAVSTYLIGTFIIYVIDIAYTATNTIGNQVKKMYILAAIIIFYGIMYSASAMGFHQLDFIVIWFLNLLATLYDIFYAFCKMLEITMRG